jgi:hypothetical protein
MDVRRCPPSTARWRHGTPRGRSSTFPPPKLSHRARNRGVCCFSITRISRYPLRLLSIAVTRNHARVLAPQISGSSPTTITGRHWRQRETHPPLKAPTGFFTGSGVATGWATVSRNRDDVWKVRRKGVDGTAVDCRIVRLRIREAIAI